MQMTCVEVAPYWNVNQDIRAMLFEDRVGRSSSILECKYKYYFIHLFLLYVEVAPYWNVNFCINPIIFINDTVEVAPYWNVNLFYKV